MDEISFKMNDRSLCDLARDCLEEVAREITGATDSKYLKVVVEVEPDSENESPPRATQVIESESESETETDDSYKYETWHPSMGDTDDE